MARALRIEFAGALYHVTARGNARGDIHTHNEELENYLELLGNACKRLDWYCHAYCLMANHYHLLIKKTICSSSLAILCSIQFERGWSERLKTGLGAVTEIALACANRRNG